MSCHVSLIVTLPEGSVLSLRSGAMELVRSLLEESRIGGIIVCLCHLRNVRELVRCVGRG
jgi:hypothetical protein